MVFSRRVFSYSLALGLLALLLSGLSLVWVEHLELYVSKPVVFFCSIAFGIPGALLSSAVALLPEAMARHELGFAARMVLLCALLGYAKKRYPRVPAVAMTTIAWVFVLLPLELTFSLTRSSNLQFLLLSALADVCLVGLAELTLLIPSVWTSINNTPRKSQVNEVLVSVITVVTSGLTLLTLTIPHGVYSARAAEMVYGSHPELLTLLTFGATVVSALCAWWLGRTVPQLLEIRGGLRHSSRPTINTTEGQWNLAGSSPDSSLKMPRPRWKEQMSDGGDLESPAVQSAAQSEGVCALQPEGTVIFVNEQFRDVAQVHDEHLAGKMLQHIHMNADIRQHLLSILDEVPESGAYVTEFKVNQLPESLRFFSLSVERFQSQPEEGKEETLGYGIVLTLRDITERRTVESHLLQAQKLKSLGSVTGGIAHAFNNSLTSIIGHASFALRSKDETNHRVALTEILQAAHKAGEFVWKLLEFSEGKPSLMKHSDLRTVVSDRLEFLRKLVGERYELSYSQSEDSLCVLCDPNLLTQTLTDLISNAKESYRDGQGRIEISLDTEEMESAVASLYPGARAGKFVRLRVRDYGAGMGSECVARAFDPLFTTKAKEGHSGLGLSIVFAIVRAHDGFLTVESFPEKGTTISIYLPLKESVSESNEQSENSTVQGHSQAQLGKRILVVEDEPNIRELISRMLETLGYQVENCQNGREALVKCERSGFDLVLCDMMMPQMGGLEFVQKLHERHESPRALVMTGFGLVDEIHTMGVPILNKPFDIDTLAKEVSKALNEEAPV